MSIPQNIRDSGGYMYQEEMFSLLQSANYSPSLTNLWYLRFNTPDNFDKFDVKRFDNLGNGKTHKVLNYYAQAVNLPSKQLTTGQVSNVGVPYKYATGQAFSQISITFVVPRNQLTRAIFERWIASITSDSDQYVDYYENYVCPELRIFKYELGSGTRADEVIDSNASSLVRRMTLGGNKSTQRRLREKQRMPKLRSVYELRNIFPTNIGSMQLNNTEPRLSTFTVSFSYERYKFYNDGPDMNKQRDVKTDPREFPGHEGFGDFLTEKND